MKKNSIPIGKLISDELERQGQSVQWLADSANTSLQNCYKMLHAESLNTDVLRTLSIVLHHNFFADYAALLELPQTPPPVLEPGDLHEGFYTLIEPILEKAGYKWQVLKSGKFVVTKGRVRIVIYHRPIYEDNRYECVCFRFALNDKRLKQLWQPGGLLIINALAFNNPELNVTYISKGPISVAHTCTILEPQDIIAQLRCAIDLYLRAREQFKSLLPQIYEEFLKIKNNPLKD